VVSFIQPRGGVQLAGATLGLDYGTTADYYVDGTNGDDGNAGTSFGAAFATIQQAVDTIAGLGTKEGVIAIANGTYREQVSLGSTAFTTTGITLQPYSTHTPTISGADVVTGWSACTSDDSDILGSAWPNCYYKDVDLSGVTGITPAELNLHENGDLMQIAFDSDQDLDPLFPGEDDKYHTADSFGVDGGGDITSIVDASVINSSNYTNAQLVNARVTIYHSPNAATIFDIDSANVGTNTISVTTGEAPQSGPVEKYALINAGPRIQPGQWAYKAVEVATDTYRVYVWPTDTASLTAGIEGSFRNRCIALSNATGAINLEGLSIVQTAGTGLGVGSPVSHTSGAASATRRGPITIRNCVVGQHWCSNDGYGAIFIRNADDCVLENNTIRNCANSFGIFMQCCSDCRVSKNLLNKTAAAGIRWFGGGNSSGIWSERNEVSFNFFLANGRNAHSNLVNFYEGCDFCLLYGNIFQECSGYLTWQEASNIFIGFNSVEIDRYDTISPRAIVDQNHASDGEPDESDAVCYVWNNRILPRPGEETTYTNGLNLGTSNSPQVFEVYNNIIHGGGVNRVTNEALLQAQEGNLYTAYTTGWAQGADDLEASETYDATMANTYVDSADNNHRYAAGGNAGLAGFNVVSLVAAAEAAFPGFNFKQDMFGHPFDPRRPFIGPFNPKFRS
jgi:parallel beta-helix repeat protein